MNPNSLSSDRCLFCDRIQTGALAAENELAAAFPDGFPVSPGHTLIVPKRHETDFFALTNEERDAIMTLATRQQQELAESTEATAFNIGVNAGSDAGQTIGHAHLHLIPRFSGDIEDPRGGVRWVIPHKAPYWTD